MSFGKVKCGKSLEIYFQKCVGTQNTQIQDQLLTSVSCVRAIGFANEEN